MLTYPWKCTVLHCNHLVNTWKPLVLMTQHFDYWPRASEGDNQSVRSSAPVVSTCFPGGYNVKLYISRGRLAWWLLAFFAQSKLSQSINKCISLQNYNTKDFFPLLRTNYSQSTYKLTVICSAEWGKISKIVLKISAIKSAVYAGCISFIF